MYRKLKQLTGMTPVDDIAVIREEAEKNGLAFVHYKEKNRWAEVKFIYQG